MKLLDILLSEYSKSQREFILSKINSLKSTDTDALLNSLNQQGIPYQDIKKQIEDKKINDIDDLKKLKTQSKSDIKKQHKSNVVTLLNDENFLIIQPKTFESNCYYGVGTKWCTVSKEEGKERFENYTEYLPITFIIDKNKPSSDPLYKVAFSYESYYKISPTGDKIWEYEIEAWDAEDNQINYKKYLTYLKSKGVNVNMLKVPIK